MKGKKMWNPNKATAVKTDLGTSNSINPRSTFSTPLVIVVMFQDRNECHQYDIVWLMHYHLICWNCDLSKILTYLP